MIKNIKYITIEIVIILFLLFLIPPAFIKQKVVVDREGGQASFNLSTGKTFVQKVVNHDPNLDTISIQLKNPLIKNNSQIAVEINDINNTNLVTFTFYGANVADPSWIKLKTVPLNESNFTIKVSADKDPNDLFLYVNQDNQMDLVTTSYLPGYFNRLKDNFNYQINNFTRRNTWHNLTYFLTIIILNVFLFKTSDKKIFSKKNSS